MMGRLSWPPLTSFICFPLGTSISSPVKWEKEMMPLWGWIPVGAASTPSRKDASLAPGSLQRSQSAATSLPGLLATSGWAQSSGHAAEKGGAAQGVKVGPPSSG